MKKKVAFALFVFPLFASQASANIFWQYPSGSNPDGTEIIGPIRQSGSDVTLTISKILSAIGSTNVLPQGVSAVARSLSNMLSDRSEALNFGCSSVVNTASDAAPCISATLADAATRHRTAHFAGGVYRILSAVTVPATPATMEGDGWDQVGPTGGGTWFSIGWGGGVPFAITGGSGWQVRHMGFAQDQPVASVGWAPTAYPPVFDLGTVSTSVDSASFEDIMIFGVYDFARFSYAQRPYVRKIYGEPFHSAFDFRAVADVAHMIDGHFWPFWLFSTVNNGTSTAAQNAVVAWQNANGVPIISRRNDNPVFADNFCFGYKALYQFDAQTTGTVTGITSRFTITGGGADASQIGVWVTGNATSGQISNFYHTGSDYSSTTNAPLSNSFGVYDPGTNTLLDITNWRETNIDSSAFAIPNVGENSDFNISNARIEMWSHKTGTAAPAFYAADGNVIKVSGANTFAGTAGSDIIPGILQSANIIMPDVQEMATTTSGSPVVQMTTDGTGTVAWNGLNIPFSRACVVKAVVVGRDVVTQDAASWELYGLYTRGASGAATLQNQDATPFFHTTGAASWASQFVQNSAIPNVAINVSQASGTNNVVWRATVSEDCQ